MKNIDCTHTYGERLVENIIERLLPIYDLWSIRPLQNKKLEHISGKCSEVDKFRNFLEHHANKDWPHELLIILANAEKNYPTIMLNTSKTYLKMKFDHYPPGYLGEPVVLSNRSY